MTPNDTPTRESVTRELLERQGETEVAWMTIMRNTRREAELHAMLALLRDEELRRG